jgi:hypothetical protein
VLSELEQGPPSSNGADAAPAKRQQRGRARNEKPLVVAYRNQQTLRRHPYTYNSTHEPIVVKHAEHGYLLTNF